MKKTILFVLSFLMSFSVAACGTKETAGTEYGSIGEAEVWGAPSTEKVLQNVNGIYDSFKTAAKIDVLAAKNEYEGSQIIISAGDKPLVYDISVSDLKAEDGTVFPSDGVEVFSEAYITVSSNYDNTKTPVGKYPDALIPFDAAKKLNENVVAKNENQGIYFRFNISAEQKAGTYTGTYKIKAGGGEVSVPVTLTVTDVTVSETSHAKSIFSVKWLISKGELDTTQEMVNKYTEALFEYRLNPQDIIFDSNHTDEDIAYYTELAYTFMQNPKCANLTIPYAQKTIDGQVCIDPDILDKYLVSLAKKSFETGYNMLAKEMCYFTIIDEPQANGLLERLKVVMREFNNQLEKTAAKLEADTSITADNKAEVIASIRGLQNVVTATYSDEYSEYVETWCPQFNEYNTEEERGQYADQQEKWWYGCISPRAPYPTYHTEDTLLSARSVGWMQAEYNITGNLFWYVTAYAEYDGSVWNDLEDYYTGSATRFPNTNGDGYLFYPGKKYGVDGPLGSLRLEAIRDGYEEYELLYALKNQYGEINEKLTETGGAEYTFDSNKMVTSLTDIIYTGTQVSTSSQSFFASRKALLELSELNSTSSQIALADYSDDGYGTKTYKFIAKNGTEIKNNGKTVEDVSPLTAGYSIYTVSEKLENTSNKLSLSVVSGGKEYTFEKVLGGKVSVTGAEEAIAADFTKENVTPTFNLVEASSLLDTLNGKAAEITVPAAAEGTEKAFRLAGSLINKVDSETSNYIIHIYYAGDDNPEITISSKHKKQNIYIDISKTVLKQGLNEIIIPFSSKNFDKLGSLDYLLFYFGKSSAASSQTLYITDTVVYGK